jgi:hypothetical protein
VFQAGGDTTYLVAVDAKNGNAGPIRLGWERSDNPSVVKSATEVSVVPGQTIHYGIDVTNGLATLTQVTFADEGAQCDDGDFPTTLLPLHQVHVDCTHEATGADYGRDHPNQAVVSSEETGPVPSNTVHTPVVLPPHGFSDVPVAAAYDEAVRYVKFFGIVTGFPDNTYRPGTAVNRGQIVNMLWHLMDEPDEGYPKHRFADVKRSAYYSEALDWAKAEGLVTGFPGNLYKPKDPVNRAQLVSMLWNMAGRPSVGLPHPYADATKAWYQAALRWAHANGLLVDIAPSSTFKPKQAATRAEVALVLFRLADTPDAWDADPPSTVLF